MVTTNQTINYYCTFLVVSHFIVFNTASWILFVLECVRFEKTREVLAYPLSTEEEAAFFTYLETINHPYAYDIRVFYNIMKSRFLDAYELNTRAHLNKFTTKNSSEQENATLRDFMISAYKKLMPEVSQKLLSACQKERTAGLWMEGKSNGYFKLTKLTFCNSTTWLRVNMAAKYLDKID